jgi:hypothetical protein
MNRRPDWCVVVCLVGQGQEINTGEAGIGAWVQALDQPNLRHWRVHAPPQLLAADTGLERQLQWLLRRQQADLHAELHLAVAVRSFRAEAVSAFVGALLDGNQALASSLLPSIEHFPIWRTRSLASARLWLRRMRRAGERLGLLASSNAIRLKPEGLHVKVKIDVPTWFLNPGDDIRSSNALEDAATEFDVQGLELDWTCVAWDLNFRRIAGRWQAMRFRGTSWQAINEVAAQAYVRNAYRVLLTRARQGMVLFIPKGSSDDETRPPAAYDAIDQWLEAIGIPVLPAELGAAVIHRTAIIERR